jgi:hypothetical protein
MPRAQEKLSHACILSAASMDEAMVKANALAMAAVCAGS